MAAIKRGKHVYCEKPLAHSVYEVRQLMKAAKEHNVVTQLGNQGHSFDTTRIFCEWIADGAIGNVHTIHAGCSAVNSGGPLRPATGRPVPATLDWDLWLGPAQQRPYSPRICRALAGLGPLRQRDDRRLGLPRRRSGVLGPRSRLAQDRSRPRSRTTTRRPRPTSTPGRPDHVRVRGQGEARPGDADLVQRLEPIPRPPELEPGRQID